MSQSKPRAKPGQFLRPEFDRPKQISYKGEVDIVTESDRRSEALIVTRLRKHFPDHAIIAEEGSGSSGDGAKYCWHVDPLDGTTNFRARLSVLCRVDRPRRTGPACRGRRV